MAGVAQSVERQIVALVVARSSRVARPQKIKKAVLITNSLFIYIYMVIFPEKVIPGIAKNPAGHTTFMIHKILQHLSFTPMLQNGNI